MDFDAETMAALFNTNDSGSAPVFLLKEDVLKNYCPIDLSDKNPELDGISISDHRECQRYIDQVLARHGAKVAYGGYLEQRRLYAEASRFADGPVRNIHLGIDFWAPSGSKVLTAFEGTIHSFKNNADFGNYGPTIVLEHYLGDIRFYTLYGHLSLPSLNGLFHGKKYRLGEVLGTLGTPDINVGYAPHLHFQIIMDLQGNHGDYPGVCHLNDLEFYKKNCPNPKHLLKF